VRDRHPDLLVSVDTWRAPVARAAADAGADLVNDTWSGHDPELAEVAAERGLGLVCSHTGGALPRTDPYRVQYTADEGHDGLDGVVDDVVRTVSALAARAVALGVDPAAVLVDPTHDFGKTTWHSLHLVRRTEALVALGHPVLMALSRKDFVGETLDLPPEERLEGTLAATAVAAWLGARVFRAHDVRATRRTLDMVASVRGERPPARAVRGLA
jgi:dihydropteroate synthase